MLVKYALFRTKCTLLGIEDDLDARYLKAYDRAQGEVRVLRLFGLITLPTGILRCRGLRQGVDIRAGLLVGGI